MSLLLNFLGISLLIQIVLFIPAFIFKTDKLTDMAYGITFFIIALIGFSLGSGGALQFFLLMMIFFWSLRLIVYLFIRIQKIGRDKRFDKVRMNFFKFLAFFVFQGFLVWVIMIPSIYHFESEATFSYMNFIGVFIFAVGLIVESAADMQKFRFKNNPKNKDKWCNVGIWKYSRHPNYFGEILIWIGIYLFTFSGLDFYEKLIGFLSPLIIFIILRFITGVPPLEKKYDKKFKDNKEYQNYKKNTGLLVPKFWRG